MTTRAPTGVSRRELVGKLAPSEPIKAVEIARSISDSWYRCQSLAQVAWHLEDRNQYKRVIDQALTAAYEQNEPNRIVSVASWAVRAMVKRNDPGLRNVVDRLVDQIQLEPNPVRQADALFLLFEAVFSETRLRCLVLDALLRACAQMNSWRRPRLLSDIALVLAIDDPNRAAEIVDTIGEGRKMRQTLKEIAAGKWLGPHEFFPYYAKPAR